MSFVADRRLRWLAGAWAALAAGCDDAGYSFGDSGFDTGLDSLVEDFVPTATTASTTSPGPIAMAGTQVGSEGFWTCTVLGSQIVPDGAAVIPSLDASAADATAARVGSWPLSMVLTDTTAVAGTLALADDGVYLWVDVAETPEDPACVDHLAASVRGDWIVGAWVVPVTGVVAVRPTDGRLVLDADAALADLEAQWGPTPLDPASTQLRLDAGVTPSALAGTASYADCPDLVCAGTAPLADVSSARP